MEEEFQQSIDTIIRLVACEQKLDEAIVYAERLASTIPNDTLHKMIGMNLSEHTDAMVNDINVFVEKVVKHEPVVALYAEITGWNNAGWKGEIVSYYSRPQNPDDYFNWIYSGEIHYDGILFPLTVKSSDKPTLADIMYKLYYADEDYSTFQFVEEIGHFLAYLRYEELFRNAFQVAKERGLSWAKVPAFIAPHVQLDLFYIVQRFPA